MRSNIKNNNYCFDELYISGVRNPALHLSGMVNSNDIKIVISCGDKLINQICFSSSLFFGSTIPLKRNMHKISIDIIKQDKCIDNICIINSKINRISNKLKSMIRLFFINGKLTIKSVLKPIYYCARFPKAYCNRNIRKMLNNRFKIEANTKVYYITDNMQYQKWITKYEHFSSLKKLSYNPLISIIIPCYNPDIKFLKECIDSILNQTYQNFEICIADDCSTKEYVKKVLQAYEKSDKRIKVIYRKKNGNISDASNSAISIAHGEFIGLVDDDDVLMPNALYENVRVLNDNHDLDFIYSDEDKLGLNGKRCLPHFKPDYSPDTLLSLNYITHFAVLRTSIVNAIGGFRTKYNGAQDYDLFLRFSEKTVPDRICHIAKVLYHWRMSATSTALNMDCKEYAGHAGQTVIEDTLKRRKLIGSVIAENGTTYYIKYGIDNNDKVSIIIPTKDHVDVLKRCIDSIYKYTSKSLFEVIIVDNNSSEIETHNYFKTIIKQYDNISVITDNGDFNYSRINNEASKKAKYKYLLLLNNDIEIIQSDWLELMIGYAKQDHVGAVGVKLLYPNGTIQHAGVVLGLGPSRIAGHAFCSSSGATYGCYGRTNIPYNYSAVTAACLMVDKNKFLSVGGFDEKLAVSYNDVDLCLSLLKKGYFNVLLPKVICIHYESLSRGFDNTYEKMLRSSNEMIYMRTKWGKVLLNDPFYNKNLSLNCGFTLNTDKNR